jgi:hypothetical protein
MLAPGDLHWDIARDARASVVVSSIIDDGLAPTPEQRHVS